LTQGFPYFKASQSPAGSDGEEVEDVETYQSEEIVSPSGTAAKLGPVRKPGAPPSPPHQNLEEFLDLISIAKSSDISSDNQVDCSASSVESVESQHCEENRQAQASRTAAVVGDGESDNEEVPRSVKLVQQKDRPESALLPRAYAAELAECGSDPFMWQSVSALEPAGNECRRSETAVAAGSHRFEQSDSTIFLLAESVQATQTPSQFQGQEHTPWGSDVKGATVTAGVPVKEPHTVVATGSEPMEQSTESATLLCKAESLHSRASELESSSKFTATTAESLGVGIPTFRETAFWQSSSHSSSEHLEPLVAPPETDNETQSDKARLQEEVFLLHSALTNVQEWHENSCGLVAQLGLCMSQQEAELAELQEEALVCKSRCRQEQTEHEEVVAELERRCVQTNEENTELSSVLTRGHVERAEAVAAVTELRRTAALLSRTQTEHVVAEQRLSDLAAEHRETAAALTLSRSECQAANENAEKLSTESCKVLAILRVLQSEHLAASKHATECDISPDQQNSSPPMHTELRNARERLADAEDRLQGAWVAAHAWEERATAAEHKLNTVERSAAQSEREAASAQAHAAALVRLIADQSPSVRPVMQVSGVAHGGLSDSGLNERSFQAAIAAADHATRQAEERASLAVSQLERALGPSGEVAIAKSEAKHSDEKRLDAEAALARESSRRVSAEHELKRATRRVSDLDRQITTFKADERKAARSASESVSRLDRRVRDLEAALAKAMSQVSATREQFEQAVRSGEEQRRCAEHVLDAERASARQAQAKSEKFRLRTEQLESRLSEAERRLACAVPSADEVVVDERELASLHERLKQQDMTLTLQAEALRSASQSTDLMTDLRTELDAALASESAASEEARLATQEAQTLRESHRDACQGFQARLRELEDESQDASSASGFRHRDNTLAAVEFLAGSEDGSVVRPTPRSADAGAGACGATTTQIVADLTGPRLAEIHAGRHLAPQYLDPAVMKEIEAERNAALRDAAHFRMVAQQVAARCGVRQQELERDMQRWKSVAQALVVTRDM